MTLRLVSRLSALAALAVLLVSLTANASVLVKYPFNNSADGNNGFNYSTFDSGVLTSSVVSSGSGLGKYEVGTDGFPGSIEVLKTGPNSSISTATAADAFTNDWYFQFVLTPSSSMDIRSIEADWSRGGTSGARGWYVRSSQDGYTNDLFTNTTPDGTAKGLQHAAFNVSGFTGISSPVTFRFYIWTAATGRYMDFQNVQFNSHSQGGGTVPEPSSALIVGLTCGGFLLRRRRIG